MLGKLMKIALFFAGVLAFSNYLLKWALGSRLDRRSGGVAVASNSDGHSAIGIIGGADGPTAIYLKGKPSRIVTKLMGKFK